MRSIAMKSHLDRTVNCLGLGSLQNFGNRSRQRATETETRMAYISMHRMVKQIKMLSAKLGIHCPDNKVRVAFAKKLFALKYPVFGWLVEFVADLWTSNNRPSLNIYKLFCYNEICAPPPRHWCPSRWARKGSRKRWYLGSQAFCIPTT